MPFVHYGKFHRKPRCIQTWHPSIPGFHRDYPGLMAVADVYDALVAKRNYKEGMSEEKAIEIVKSGSGTQFDPAIVDAFLKTRAVEAEVDAKAQTKAEADPVDTEGHKYLGKSNTAQQVDYIYETS